MYRVLEIDFQENFFLSLFLFVVQDFNARANNFELSPNSLQIWVNKLSMNNRLIP
jgi:hypothetical protein